MPTKAQVKAAAQFTADKSAITTAFNNIALADHSVIRETMQRHMADVSRWQEIKLMCYELAGVAYVAKHKIALDRAGIDVIARTPYKKVTPAHQPIAKAMDNRFSYFCNTIGVTSPNAAASRKKSGASPAGSRKAAAAARAAVKRSEVKQTSDAPVSIETVVIEATDIAALKAGYETAKNFCYKFQVRNAKAYRSEEGGKLLALHDLLMKTFNEIAKA